MPRPIKVGIDLAPASRTADAPGTARLVAEQARALFATPVDWEWVPLVEGKSNPLWNDVEHLHPEVVPERRVWTRAVFSVGAAWRRRNCDLGFATAYFTPLAGIPVVANFFDSNLYEHGDTWISSGRRLNYYLNRSLFRLTIQRARKLFVLSEYCRAVLARIYPYASDRLVVAPCGIHPPMKKKHPCPSWMHMPAHPFFLYVGVFSDNKNQRTLLQAWSELQRLHPDLPALLLIGPCPADYRSRVVQPLLSSLPRPGEVICPGAVPDDDLHWAYQHALGYIQPSIAEGFGLPVAEAMSYGLAVASSRTTSLPEVGGDAVIYFDPLDAFAIAECITTLWRDPALRRSLALRGLVRSNEFRWEKNALIVANQIEAVTQTLC